MNFELSQDETECSLESVTLEKLKMFKTYRVKELWRNDGDNSHKLIKLVRGSTTIIPGEGEENVESLTTDSLYNLGDRLIMGDINDWRFKESENYAFVYRGHVSNTVPPFKLPYSYNLIWDSSGESSSFFGHNNLDLSDTKLGSK